MLRESSKLFFDWEPDLGQNKAVAEGIREVVLDSVAAVQENYQSLFTRLFVHFQVLGKVDEDF